MTVDILIPCKRFHDGKSRLAEIMAPEERVALCRTFLNQTIALARAVVGGDRVTVVSDDSEVLDTAARAGALTIRDPGHGLNAALAFANASLASKAAAHRLLIMPIDLPFAAADRLEAVLESPADVVVVPDKKEQGTNLLLLDAPTRRDFPFAFGANSFQSHLDVAATRNLRLAVFRDAHLAFDIDDESDLLAFRDLGKVAGSSSP